MDYNISFKIISKNIYISRNTKKTDVEKLNNTNIITTDDIIFSVKYIRKNFDLVVNFLNLILLKYNVNTVVVEDSTMDLVYLDMVKQFKHIEKIIFSDNEQIGSDIFVRIYEFNDIKKIECYEMPAYLIERFDVNKDIKVLTRHKITKKNLFLIDNHLTSYTDFYYKKQLIVNVEMNEDIIKDLDNFMTINTRLKLIRIIKYSNEAMITILDSLSKHNKKNIVISINEKDNNLNEVFQIINYIKKQYKKYIETNKIQFKINYSNDYKLKNFFKELNLKIVCTILFIVLALAGTYAGLTTYQQYEDEQKIKNQLSDIDDLINSLQESSIDNNTQDINLINKEDYNLTTTKGPAYISTYYADYSHVISELKKQNKDTVGWITVNNTRINYPTVQANDNEYYLNHDFKKWKNTMGWVFMDYRNNPNKLDANTILYGHNVQAGIMFGTLKNTLNAKWYKNENNHIITFNTEKANMKWKVFSVYKTPVTIDYLETEFASVEEHQAFINLIKGRSLYDFGTEVTTNDKILTLSSCINNTTRSVLHAVLIEENQI